LEAFGSEPSGVWSAPGRVNLIGEHTDYNAGLCLPIALPHRAYAAVRLRADRRLRLRSMQSRQQYELDLDDVGVGDPPGWGGYAAGVLWALQEAGHQVRGIDLMLDGRVPLGAGLSSSAALECSVAAAVSDLLDLGLMRDDHARATLATICVNAENTIAQAPTGGMDQSAALRCQIGQALLLDCRDDSVAQVPFDLSAHGLSLLIMDTRVEHTLDDGQYALRRASCEEAARQLGLPSLREVDFNDLANTLGQLSDHRIRARARHVVTEIERVRQTVALLLEGRLAEVGGNDSRSPGRPDDRRRIRRLSHRTSAHRRHAGGDLGSHAGLRRQRIRCTSLLLGHRRRTRPARVMTTRSVNGARPGRR
jgi:galactokinase